MSRELTVIERLRIFNYVATLCRFNIVILLAGTVLLSVDQGQDLLRSIAEDHRIHILLGGGLLWALSIWYWARVLLNIRFSNPPFDLSRDCVKQRFEWWRAFMPRLLGAAAFLSLDLNQLRASGWGLEFFLTTAATAGFFLFVWRRRDLMRAFTGHAAVRNRSFAPLLRPADWQSVEQLPDTWDEALKLRVVRAIVVLGLILLAWGFIHPLSMGQHTNALLLLFLTTATFLPWGSALTYQAQRHGWPLFSIIVAVLLLSSFSNDNHRIRSLPAEDDQQRPTLEAALDTWTAAHGCVRDSRCPPFVVMATAGGGIRAAYWTGTVLGELDDRLPTEKGALARHLFAISGVSGGSVGATVYRAVLSTHAVLHGQRREAIQKMLGRDYLGPLAAGLLYPDMAQRFLFFPAFQDRATVFEEGLEAGYAEEIRKGVFNGSFTSLHTLPDKDGQPPLPALFLNSTWSDNGRRIVAAGYRTNPDRVFYADLLEQLGHDLRLSTAAHNSARFPFASPPGSWCLKLSASQLAELDDIPECDDASGQEADGRLLQRLQDGGLFENYGAETALELLKQAERYFRENGMRFDPIVILVSSDPQLPENLAVPKINPPIGFAYELLSTFHTYATTRVGRGAEAASRLKDWTIALHTLANKDRTEAEQIDPDSRFAYLRMCDDKEQESPPLGWSLSRETQRSIENYLYDSAMNSEAQRKEVPSCRKGNNAALDKLLTALTR